MTGSDEQARRVRRRGFLLLVVALLAILGVADGVYLTLVHVDYEMGKSSSELAEVCGRLASRGCLVTTGRFGSIFGIPISLVGIGGAAATAAVAVGAWVRRALPHDPWRSTLLALVGLSVLASVVMAVLSTLERSYCPFCVLWYGINLGLGVTTWLARGSEQHVSAGQVVDDALGRPGLVAIAAFGVAFAAGHWLYHERKAQLRVELDQMLELRVAQIRQGPTIRIDLRGLPTRGPEDATLTIVEVADFQCPYCRRLWDMAHDYYEHSTASVRTAFIHYPLDDACNGGVEGIHPLACAAAEAAECARRQDEAKFWDYGDLLFAHQPAFERDELLDYAGQLGLDTAAFGRCLDEHQSLPEIRRSIRQAITMDVRATPTYYVNGHEFRGAPQPWVPILLDKWARVIQAEPPPTPPTAPTPENPP